MLIVRLLLAVTIPFVSLGQSTNETTLSPKAQAAVEQGLSAAKQQQWKIAIESFQEARQAAPDSPVPLVNLGLAEAQVPGRELRAICFFEAYLALVPNAVNAPAVRQQITDLEARAENNARKMIELLKGTAAKLSESHRNSAQENVASLLVRIGDLDAAKAILDQFTDNSKEELQWKIVAALAETGRFVDAIKQADQIKSDTYKSAAYKDIAVAQIGAGLLPEAKTSLDVILGNEPRLWPPDEYYDILFPLAEAQYQAGQREEAATLLRDAKASIDKITGEQNLADFDHKKFLIQFAVAEYKTGQREVGEALLQQIRNSMGDLRALGPKPPVGKDYGLRMVLLNDLAKAANEMGQRQKALQFLKEAEKAQRAGNAANEIIPYAVFDGYMEMQDWDGAKALLWREVSDGYARTPWSKAEKKDWVAEHLEEITNAKAAIVYASAKASSIKMLANATSSPAQRAQAWCDYMNATMNTPLFTDFKVTLEGLANYVPEERVYEDTSIFARLEKQAEVLVNGLKDTRDLQAKQIEFAGNGHAQSSIAR